MIRNMFTHRAVVLLATGVLFSNVAFFGAVVAGLTVTGMAAADDTAAAGDTAAAATRQEAAAETGLDKLAFMIGDWVVTAKIDGQDLKTTSTIRPILEGKGLEERLTAQFGSQIWDVVMWRTFDTFQQEHRMVALDNVVGLLDVYEGRFEGDRLVQTNVEPGTPYKSSKGEMTFVRATTYDISEDGFKLLGETSTDGGKTWQGGDVYTYTRKK